MLDIQQVVGGYTSQPVLKGITAQLAAGQLVALIGLNGAGKSTLIKHIIGLMTPFSGRITINGQTLTADEMAYRRQLTYVPETPTLYEELTLAEHLELTMMAYGGDKAQARERADRYLRAFRLDDKLEWFPAYFSKGMKQKVMLVCAFMIDAAVYIIDEPFLGLDPLAIHQLLDIITEKKAAGAAVLMSTHILSTAEQKCDAFWLMHEGEIVAQGDLASIRTQYQMPDANLDDIYIAMATKQLSPHNEVH